MAAADPNALPSAANPSRLAFEVELKFEARGPAPLGLLARRRRLGPARLGPPRTVRELDRYLDTADHRLATAGWACRLRRNEERTTLSLKGRQSNPSAGAAGMALHRRRELEGDANMDLAPDRWADSEARRILLDLAAGGHVSEFMVLDQRRAQRDVIVGDEAVGLLSLDRVEVRRAGSPIGRLWCVELEFVGGAPPESLTDALDQALRAVPGLEPDVFSKLERAEALVGGAGTSTGG
jgi:inorganic triphosphatase YgiF